MYIHIFSIFRELLVINNIAVIILNHQSLFCQSILSDRSGLCRSTKEHRYDAEELQQWNAAKIRAGPPESEGDSLGFNDVIFFLFGKQNYER